MTFCDNCGARFFELPFHCRRCNEDFCSKCRLPEDHNCPGLVKKNIFLNLSRKKKHYYEVNGKYGKEYVGIRHEHKKLNFYEQIKNYIKSRYYKVKYWLNSRRHRRYSNWNVFFMNIIWIIVLTFTFLIIYSNLSKLNEIVLWFLPLGGTLLTINGIFLIRYSYRLLKRIYYWFEGERNWVKYSIIIVLLFLLWQAYQNRNNLFDPFIEKYNDIQFQKILPLSFNISLSDFNPNNIEDLDESEASNIQKILYTPPERKEESKKAFGYVNQVRKQYNRRPMEWDDNLYDLAVSISKDMVKRNYFDHVTPEGKCIKDFKADYGFSDYNVAENIGGMTHYENGDPVSDTSVTEAVDKWLNSRGHRYNLLYPSHTKGAIGCYKAICVFLGANQEYYGLGFGPCTTGDEGTDYWNSVGKQPGEI